MESTNRLLDAAIARFAAGGMRAVSIREVARAAEVDPSAIQYRFGAKANLWGAALERAMDRDIGRLDEFAEMLDVLQADHGLTADEEIALFASFAADSVAEWRDTTILWHALLIDGLRQRQPWPQAIRWFERRSNAWRAIAQRLALPSETAGDTLLLTISTVEIYLLGMERGAARALYCDTFVRFMLTRLRGARRDPQLGAWFSTWCAKRIETRLEPGRVDHEKGPVRALSDAVARLLLAHGAEEVTHRAIASEASLSLAATTRHFATLQDLLRAGYDRIGVNMLRNREEPEHNLHFTDPLAMARAVASTWLSDDAMQGRALTGLIDLHIAAARDPTLLPIASAIIAKLTELAARYFAAPNALGVSTSFEAHIHHATSQSLILFAALEGVEPEALIARSSARIACLCGLLFSTP